MRAERAYPAAGLGTRSTGFQGARGNRLPFIALLFHGLRLDFDLHGIRDENPARLERLVPSQSPLPATDRHIRVPVHVSYRRE